MSTPRNPRHNETFKSNRNNLQYFNELGLNTYYYNRVSGIEYEKQWVTLPCGKHRETFVSSNRGYWRRHWYCSSTGDLLKEIDSNGHTELLEYRKKWDPTTTEVSRESKTCLKPTSTQLF